MVLMCFNVLFKVNRLVFDPMARESRRFFVFFREGEPHGACFFGRVNLTAHAFSGG